MMKREEREEEGENRNGKGSYLQLEECTGLGESERQREAESGNGKKGGMGGGVLNQLGKGNLSWSMNEEAKQEDEEELRRVERR